MMNCEKVLMAKMAEIDGEITEISSEQINSHLVNCHRCRQEFEQIDETFNLLRRQARREQEADLWPAIEKRIKAKTNSPIEWTPFVLLGVLLVVYKLIEMLPERNPGLALKFVPLILIVALFVLIKENPFKINTELTLEK